MKSLLTLLRRRESAKSLLSVCPAGNSVTSVRVSRPAEGMPQVDAFTHNTSGNRAQQKQMLQGLARQIQDRNVPVTSVVETDCYHLVLLEKPEVPANELRAATRWRVRDLIDFHIDDAVIDVFDVPARRDGGSAKSMFAVVAKATTIKQSADDLLDAGFELKTLDIPEFALRNIARCLPEDKGGVAFIHLADGGGLITVTREGELYLSRRLTRGAEVLLAGNEAELTAELEGWLDSVVIEVQRSLDYYESQFAQNSVAGVVIAPLPWPAHGVVEYLSSQLGLPTRILDLAEIVQLVQPLSPAEQARGVIALGAALRTSPVSG